jgi:hypothetical protein
MEGDDEYSIPVRLYQTSIDNTKRAKAGRRGSWVRHWIAESGLVGSNPGLLLEPLLSHIQHMFSSQLENEKPTTSTHMQIHRHGYLIKYTVTVI